MGRAAKALLFVCALCALSLVFTPGAEARTHPYNHTGKRIVRVGESYLGTPHYELSCSEFTRLVIGRATGVWMPADPASQKYYGWRSQHMHKGDLVFFKENGRYGGITHVGIFAGYHNGVPRILHSSSYFGEVIVSDMRYIVGFHGKRRIR